MDIGNPNESSIFIDHASDAIIVPSREEILIRDPDEYMKRLDDLQTPRERLIELLISIFDLHAVPTHESLYIRNMALIGACGGLIYGGFLKDPNYTQEYARKFNAATFEGRTLARKHYTDTYIYTAFGRGFKYAIGGGILCGAAGVISFSSITYRNRLYYPDWAVGFTAFGSLIRFWSLGLRGAAGGGGFGLIGGTIGYGLAKLFEFASGKSISEIRYLNHRDYLSYRQSKRERLMKVREKFDQEKFRRME